MYSLAGDLEVTTLAGLDDYKSIGITMTDGCYTPVERARFADA
jgi:hypothetical protein